MMQLTMTANLEFKGMLCFFDPIKKNVFQHSKRIP